MFYYIYRLPLMITKRQPLLPRRDIIELKPLQQPDLMIAKGSDKYRNSMAVDYRSAQRESWQGWNRYSASIGSSEKPPRVESRSPNSTLTMQSIRETLNQLQVRIDSAKEELRGNVILGKSVIEQQDQEDSRTLDLISFKDSVLSHQTEENKGTLAKRQPQKREISLVELSKVKTYYKSELAKIFTTGNQRARDHLVHSWKIINAYRNLFDPNPQANPKQGTYTNASQRIDKKTLVIGLDGALINCSNERKSEQDIQFYLPSSKGGKTASYLRIRPHAISFLKKTGKKYEIAIFSNRNQAETDTILQQLDPLGELFTLRLYNDSCSQVGNFQVKDLRVLKRDLSSVVLVDSTPCSYLQQLNNGVPLLPFIEGPDCELYALEKYLEQLSKARDIREPNGEYFQLTKYGGWEEPLQGAKGLYFYRE